MQANARTTTLGLFLRVYLAMAGLLFMHARCEESSILDLAGVTQLLEDKYDQDDADVSQALIDGNFGTVSRTVYGSVDDNASMLDNRQTIKLSAPKSIRTVLTVNSYARDPFGDEKYYLGEAYVAVGSSLESLTKVSENFYDTQWSTVSTSAATG